jgi:hypothetical protein
MDASRRFTDHRADAPGFIRIRSVLLLGGMTVALAAAFSIASQGAQPSRGLIGLLAVSQLGEQLAGAGGLHASASPISQLIR